MSTSPHRARGTTPPRGAPSWAPWWAWAVVVLLALGAVVTLTAAVLVARARAGSPVPGPGALPGAAGPEDPGAPAAPAPGPAEPAAVPAAARAVDGCLGGPSDLDEAVLTAQREAPLTEAGAASFAGTLLRWATATPAPPGQARTAEQVLTPDATPAARNLSGLHDPRRSTLTTSLADGRWYVEEFRPGGAVVSVLARATGTREGEPQGDAWIAGSLVLSSDGGVWRLRDVTGSRSVPDLLDVGLPYPGGC